jgi:hypothetical protein
MNTTDEEPSTAVKFICRIIDSVQPHLVLTMFDKLGLGVGLASGLELGLGLEYYLSCMMIIFIEFNRQRKWARM